MQAPPPLCRARSRRTLRRMDVHASTARLAAFRLAPGEDLIEGLHAARRALDAAALSIVTSVGSLSAVTLRHADRAEGTPYDGRFEIVSLVGTVDPAYQHLHLAIADGEGRVRGGHLMPGSRVYTTAEIVVAALDDLAFDRAPCPLSGYHELVVATRRA